MHIKILLKKLISVCVAVVLAVTFTACFDLGEFESDEDYLLSFGDIRLVYQNPNSEEKDVLTEDYDVRDYFYNENTGNDFTYGDPEDDQPDEGKDIPMLSYLYMAIPIEEDMKVESLALYFNSTQEGSLKIRAYLVDELPDGGDFTNVRLFGDPEYQEKLDEEGNPILDEEGNPVLEPVVYDDPSEEHVIAETSIYLGSSEWFPMLLEKFNGGGPLQVKDSQYILLQFINNGGFKTENDVFIPFKTTNLLVRAVA